MSRAKIIDRFLGQSKSSNIIEVSAKHLGSFIIETGFDITSVKEFDVMIRKYRKINLVASKSGGKTTYQTCFAHGNYKKREPTHDKVAKVRRFLNIGIIVTVIIIIVILIAIFG